MILGEVKIGIFPYLFIDFFSISRNENSIDEGTHLFS